MKNVILIYGLMVLFMVACKDSSHNASAIADLKRMFKNPPSDARPKVYYWWLNGFTDTLVLKEELKAIKKAGIGGVDVFEIGFKPAGGMPAGPAFMSDSSLQHIAFAVNEAGRLGLTVGLNMASSWNAGGSWVKPEHASKSIYRTVIKVGRAQNNIISLPFPNLPLTDKNGRRALIKYDNKRRPLYSKELAVLAIRDIKKTGALDTAQVIDISKYFDARTDRLVWNVPPGEWEIHRYVCANSGEQLAIPSPASVGPIIDHFDSTATRAHFEYFIQKLQSFIGDLKNSALKNLYLASFEAKSRIWSDQMGEEFRIMHGYGVEKLLPVIFDSTLFNKKINEKFMTDLKQLMSEMMIRNHYQKGKQIANQYGLQLISESGGPYHHNVPVEAIRALGVLDIPRGEFWINQKRYGKTIDSVDLLFLVKQIASASHLYQRGIVELEAFTSYQNWMEAPVDMKPFGDRAFCEGMNRPVIHGFTHNPGNFGQPGMAYYAGTHYNNKVTWWPRVKPFNDYLSRISYIFQQSQFYADVLFYYGNNVPNFTTSKNTRFSAGEGFDYEIINSEKLISDLQFEDGLLTLPYGAKFKLLALGKIANPKPVLIKKIKELVKLGARIVGPPPANCNDEAFNQLWKNRFDGRFQKGSIYQIPVDEALDFLKISYDFNYSDRGSERLDFQEENKPVLDFIHYQRGGADFYFVRNTTGNTISRVCAFRQTEKNAEIWYPVNGEIAPVTISEQDEIHTKIPLTFEPYESYFIVFSKGRRPSEGIDITLSENLPSFKFSSKGVIWLEAGSFRLNENGRDFKIDLQSKSFQINRPWTLHFDSLWGAPRKFIMNRLVSWTDVNDKGIKYYSGKVKYETSFSFSSNADTPQRLYLHLGKVSRIATVWLNGTLLGTIWSEPFRFDITENLKTGTNKLEVEVINTWSNRIIGDKLLGTQYTKTNLHEFGYRDILNTTQISWTETPLLESGLLGPVTIEQIKEIRKYKD